MSFTPLRPVHNLATVGRSVRAAALPRPSMKTFAAVLLQDGLVAPHAMTQVLALRDQLGRHLTDILLAREVLPALTLYEAIAQHWQVSVADLAKRPPDPRLMQQLGTVDALTNGLLPWCKAGQVTVVATAYPDQFQRHKPRLEAAFGPVAMAVAPMHQIETAVLALHGPRLARAAETRVAPEESCRNYHSTTLQRPALLLASILAIFAFFQPLGFLFTAFGLAILAMLAANVMKVIALLLMHRPEPAAQNPPFVAHLPTVSIIVALYRESDIAPRLAARLGKLDYPRDLLDILLVVEAEDQLTRTALHHADLPGWMRVIVVPDGSVKTKPRALNYALDHCRGSIIGVYDAEDAPESDQIRKVVDRFHQRGPEVVCLQGVLDFYNPRSNWLARCFTIEYASWFRMYLPGIERMGLAVPLGGTTLFFRRRALEALGGWDAQNVTEDADLGLRLARHGYRTELIDTTTFEEPNCRSLPWVKQRSRWIKGYMMTWLTHMRNPRLLWTQLGPRRFIGLQVQFLGSVLQSLLAPLLWSFWLVPFGVPHPVVQTINPAAFTLLYVSMFAVSALTIGFDIAGMRRTKHRLNPLWAVSLTFYHPLGTLAAYKALWELLTKPFYWDKTSHGHFDL